jgi:hypothetical protein
LYGVKVVSSGVLDVRFEMFTVHQSLNHFDQFEHGHGAFEAEVECLLVPSLATHMAAAF